MTEAQAFLESAAAAAGLLADPAVTLAWEAPSALSQFTVRGLAGHLARQIIMVPELLAADPPRGQLVSLLDHYVRAPWAGASVDAEINVAVRASGEAAAACGAAGLARRTGAAIGQLRGRLQAESADRLIQVPGVPWLLTLSDFLLTRLVEIAVHGDDLAVSVGIPGPQLPPQATDVALALLTRLAARRHGSAAVLRALSRAERAPATIAAI